MAQLSPRRIAWPLIVVITYVGVVVGLDVFDWDRGHLRAAVLCVTVLALVRLGTVRVAAGSQRLSTTLAALLLAMLTFRTVETVRAYRANNYRPIDVATITLSAIALSGASPYATAIDPRPETTARSGFGFFDGYKYGPMNVVLYYPLVRLFGVAGLYFTNFVFYVATAALLVALGRTYSASRDSSAGLAAAVLFVATPFVWRETAVQGINDGLQAALLVAAIFLRVTASAAFAGLLVGLAMASKIMPAAAAFIALLPLPRRRDFIAAAALAAGLLYMTEFPAAPKEMIANLVVFNLTRAPDTTALRYFLPSWLGAAWVLLVVGVLVVLVRRHLTRHDVHTAEIVRFLTVFLAAFCLLQNAHRNYLVWFAPLLALEAATLALREDAAAGATRPSS